MNKYRAVIIMSIASCLSSASADVEPNFADSGQRLGNANTLNVMFVDIDNDGDPDLVEGNYYGAPWYVWTRVYRNSGGVFSDTGQNLQQTYGYAKGLANGDVDGDGDLDVFTDTAGWAGYAGVWHINDGNGVFSHGDDAGGGSTMAVGVADLDNDGDLDLVEGNMYDPGNSAPKDDYVLHNDGNGIFTDSGSSIGMWKTDNDKTLGINFLDIDSDNFLDIVASCCCHVPTRIYLNDGSGRFYDANCILLEGTDPNLTLGEVKVGDVNGDDLNDVVGSEGIFLNNGDGSLSYAGETDNYNIDLADFDLDGDLDLLNNGSVYLNNGLGEFTLAFTFPSEPYGTDVADVDGDGDLDCVFGFLSGRPTEIWLNTTPVCTGRPAMDFNDDCKVNFKDFAIFCESWLECNLDPPEACGW